MAEYSMFFNSQLGDRLYTASDFAQYFASFIGNGVMFGGNFLKVSKVLGMSVEMLPGKAFINGYYYANKDFPKEMTLQPADPLMPRIDRVVLRLGLRQEDRRISAVIKTGVPSGTPVPPSLQRDNEAFELGLADIRIDAGASEIFTSNITDLRLSPDFCGIVTGLIEQPDFSQAFDRYIARYEEIEAEWADKVSGWQEFTGGCETDWAKIVADTKDEWDAFLAAFKAASDVWKAETILEFQEKIGFNFDNQIIMPGTYRTFEETSEGALLEQMRFSFDDSLIAELITEFKHDGSIERVLAVYTSDGSVFGITREITTFEGGNPLVVVVDETVGG